MQYNSRNFGDLKDSLIDSPYFSDYGDGNPSPPPGEFLLLNDNGDYLLNDDEDYLATP
jgi:hypothetical protein